MTKANLKNILTAVRDIINRSSETAIRKAQSAEKQAGAAQATAKTAKTAADNAQTTADNAEATANNAQRTANNAEATANNAQRIANNAEATADNVQTAVNGCVKKNNNGSFYIYLDDNNYFHGVKGGDGVSYYDFHRDSVAKTPIVLSVGAKGGTDLNISVTPSVSPTLKIAPPAYMNNQADIEIVSRVSGVRPLITGLGGIIMYSSTSGSKKKFKITVDDSGTLTATEVT